MTTYKRFPVWNQSIQMKLQKKDIMITFIFFIESYLFNLSLMKR